MAVKLRLRRKGSKKRPFYHVVACDEDCPRDGKFLEMVGRYDPRDDSHLVLDMEAVQKWVDRGAIVSPRVQSLIERIKGNSEAKASAA